MNSGLPVRRTPGGAVGVVRPGRVLVVQTPGQLEPLRVAVVQRQAVDGSVKRALVDRAPIRQRRYDQPRQLAQSTSRIE